MKPGKSTRPVGLPIGIYKKLKVLISCSFFRFTSVFRGYIRIGLHGLIKKEKKHIFVVLHIAALLFSPCVLLFSYRVRHLTSVPSFL